MRIRGRILAECEPDGTGCYTVRAVNPRYRLGSAFYQTDWDLPSLAGVFGWRLTSVGRGRCAHDGTDGTVRCHGCGREAGDFISAASDWLHNRGWGRRGLIYADHIGGWDGPNGSE